MPHLHFRIELVAQVHNGLGACGVMRESEAG
jgi:hypothetical protein